MKDGIRPSIAVGYRFVTLLLVSRIDANHVWLYESSSPSEEVRTHPLPLDQEKVWQLFLATQKLAARRWKAGIEKKGSDQESYDYREKMTINGGQQSTTSAAKVQA
ncbi:MAG TPA: hypothetical protein VFF30_14125 [Nitrososphaerales archaeon]|nr:hypothetical protein [Nitrososphaerales archaeon]